MLNLAWQEDSMRILGGGCETKLRRAMVFHVFPQGSISAGDFGRPGRMSSGDTADCHPAQPGGGTMLSEKCLTRLMSRRAAGSAGAGSGSTLGRVERRRSGGQGNGFPSCQLLRAAWQNGHQTVHSVASAPAKIPYGGFSPVRPQTGCQPQPSLPAQLICGHSRGLPGER